MSTLLRSEEVKLLTSLGQLLEDKNKIIETQMEEISALRQELLDERTKVRAARDALAGTSAPMLQRIEAPAITAMETMTLEEFTPAASHPNGSKAKNPLADSFVL